MSTTLPSPALHSADELRRVGRRLFLACGAADEEAAAVAEELVEASLRGLDSHGVLRYAQYVDDSLCGRARPGTATRIVRETLTTATVDCGFALGPYTARRVSELTGEKAKTAGIAAVVSVNSHHIGRLGACVGRLASKGMLGLAFANSSKHGHWVVPFGAKEPRLATNPLAFAAPSENPDRPLLLDMSTSMIAEGKVRSLMQQGLPLPPGCLQDAQGQPTTDPRSFYGPPRGTILPFGGPDLGYKGFGLSLLVEVMGGLLAGMRSSADHAYINGLCVIAVSADAFCGAQQLRALVEDLSAYIRSAAPAPGSQRVVLPGELEWECREQRLRDGIPLAAETWRMIVEAGAKVGVDVDAAGTAA